MDEPWFKPYPSFYHDKLIVREPVFTFFQEPFNAAQAIFVQYGFRSASNASLDSVNPNLPALPESFTVEEMGGWTAADTKVYERIWKGEILRELRK